MAFNAAWAADDTRSTPEATRPATKELTTGADATAQSWSVYSTLTGTFGQDVRGDGWRYRFGSGYGRYGYTSSRWTGANVIEVPFDGTVTFAEALIGYQATVGKLTLKAFAGASVLDHAIAPFDIENGVQGSDWGAKAVVESWLELTERAFGQLDLAYETAFQTYAARARLGYRLWPQLSGGLEAGIAGNAAYDAGRGGAFVRYEWSKGEISISGGAAGDRSSVTSTYGTLNVLFRF